jgi:hypothetical protein
MKKFSQARKIVVLKPEAALFHRINTPSTPGPRLIRGFLETIHTSSWCLGERGIGVMEGHALPMGKFHSAKVCLAMKAASSGRHGSAETR